MVFNINNWGKMKEFKDEKFIPSKEFIESIDFTIHPNLILLKGMSIDGRLKKYNQIENIQHYVDLIQKTPNKFLRLFYFENIREFLEENKSSELLAKFKLVPLYFDVAREIIIQNNPQYKPEFLLEKYFRLSHRAKIPNQTVFDNIGDLSKILIKKQRDPSEILKPFLDLDGKVLKSASISNHIFNAINFYVNEIFDGNVTFGFYVTDKILSFYEKLDMPDEIETKKSMFASKFLRFLESKVEIEQWDEESMQSMSMKLYFLKLKLGVIQKYCPHRDDLDNEVRLEINRINKLIPKCTKGYVSPSGSRKISNDRIERILEPFKNDSLEQIIKKALLSEFFLPDIPKDIGSLSGYFSTMQFSNGNVKKFNGGKQINKNGASDISLKWLNYELDWNFRLLLFQRIISKFDNEDLLTNIYTPIKYSEVINEVSERFFYYSLKLFFNENYFACIQISVFQIESILREICSRKNIETISIEENKERQRSIGSLISKLKEIVSEKVLLFIKWLLLNEEGQISKNYRNKIAHGIDTINQFNGIYTRENALSIILIFLSLSKYGWD